MTGLDPIYLEFGIDLGTLAEWNDLDEKDSLGSSRSPIFPSTPPQSATTIPLENLRFPAFSRHVTYNAPIPSPVFHKPDYGIPDFPPTSNPLSPPSSPLRSLAPRPVPPPSAPTPHHGPGRPKKHDLKSQAFEAQKKRSHNQSASQSRARLNSGIDELWQLIPREERLSRGKERGIRERKVTRTEKIEHVIEYVMELQEEAQRVDWRS